jgi:hypothetical protein
LVCFRACFSPLPNRLNACGQRVFALSAVNNFIPFSPRFIVLLLANFKRIFMQSKKVKMQSLHRPSAKSWSGYKKVPALTISGNWLTEAGFDIGSIVEITAIENQLIIKKRNEYEQLTDY